MIWLCLKAAESQRFKPHQLKLSESQNGFAIFTVLMLSAVLGLISLAMVSNYLTNTRATTLDLQRLKAKHALEAGLNFAALSLASPRSVVSAAAIPSQELIYQAQGFDVEIFIENEAGFIAWARFDESVEHERLLDNALRSSDVDQADLDQIKALLGERDTPINEGASVRSLMQKFSELALDSTEIIGLVSLHSKHQGVNPYLASEEVLALIPDLSVALRKELMRQRASRAPSLIQRQVNSKHFTDRVSSYYRVRLATQVGDQRFEQTQLIKMINQPGRLFDVVGTF